MSINVFILIGLNVSDSSHNLQLNILNSFATLTHNLCTNNPWFVSRILEFSFVSQTIKYCFLSLIDRNMNVFKILHLVFGLYNRNSGWFKAKDFFVIL